MNAIHSWLCEILGHRDLSAQQMGDILTARGVEVEGIDSIHARLQDLVAAHVQSAEPAERGQWLQITANNKTYTVFCTDKTVQMGETLLYAPPGAETALGSVGVRSFGDRESEGVLLSEFEAGLGGNAEGVCRIDATLPLAERWQQDWILDIGITPNRGDALSHLGLARELESVDVFEGRKPALERSTSNNDVFALATLPASPAQASVQIDSPACRTYGLLEAEISTVNTAALAQVQYRIGLCGQRAIHPIVDLSNYLLFEIGQPSHAFDAAKLEKIVVRDSQPEESFVALDGATYTLVPGSCVIDCDGTVGALAGVIGGLESSSTTDTKHVALEVAWFDPILVRKARTPLGLNTDSSYRFEREIDAELATFGLQRLGALCQEVLGASLTGLTVANTEALPVSVIGFDLAACNRFLGTQVSQEDAEKAFLSLGCTLEKNGHTWQVTTPSWRPDLAIEPDLYEEIARVVGYDIVPDQLPFLTFDVQGRLEDVTGIAEDLLTEHGFHEIVSYDFYSRKDDQWFKAGTQIELQNPLGKDFAIMRRSILPGLLHSASYNLNRQAPAVALFESGRVYWQEDGKPCEQQQLAFLVASQKDLGHWNQHQATPDWMAAAATVETILQRFGLDPVRSKGICTELAGKDQDQLCWMVADTAVARLYQVPARISKAFQLRCKAWYGWLDIEALRRLRKDAAVTLANEPSQFPSAERDLALLVPSSCQAGAVLALAREQANATVANITVFDHYQGKSLGDDIFSLGLRFTFRATDRSLSSDEVDGEIARLYHALEKAFSVRLREGSVIHGETA